MFPRPFLGRQNNSSQGNGITKFRVNSPNLDKIKCDFYVEYIEVVKEFRVHIFKGHTICEFNKDFSKCEKFIHSKQFGSKLVYGKIDHPDRDNIVKASTMAINACLLDYGAVDIICDANNKWYILEVNSAPSMAHSIGFLYAERIAHYYNIPIDVWWEIDKSGKVIDNRNILKKFKYVEQKHNSYKQQK